MNQLNTETLNLPQLLSVSGSQQPDEFVGAPESYGRLGIYGGHFVGQALAAGFETVEDPKQAQSLHAYFLNPGSPDVPIHYQVTRLKEGRGVDIRSITASQNDRAVFHMTASFKVPEDGDEHQPLMPTVKSAEERASELATGGKTFEPPMMAKNRATLVPLTASFVPDEGFKPGREPVLMNWMRSNHKAAAGDRLDQCVLAFLSDGTLMFNSVLPYGIPFQTHRLTSLDHSAWFHRPCDSREWMLYDQSSSAAADGRGMNDGRVFNADGKLVMTTAQDSMLRRMG